MMRNFQGLGASLDAANHEASQALHCSTRIDPAGFSIKIHYATPETIAEGYDHRATYHPGVGALMQVVAGIVRERIDFGEVIEEAQARISRGFVEIDGLTEIINRVRMAQGLVPLAPPGAEMGDALAEAVAARDEFWEGRVEQMVKDRVAAVASAEPPAAGPGSPRTIAEPHIPGASEGLGDPPAPRGGANRRAPAR